MCQMTGKVVIVPSYWLVKAIPVVRRVWHLHMSNLRPQLTRLLMQNMKYKMLLMFVTMIPQQEVVPKVQGKVMPPLMMVGVTRLLVMMAMQYSRMKGRILN